MGMKRRGEKIGCGMPQWKRGRKGAGNGAQWERSAWEPWNK